MTVSTKILEVVLYYDGPVTLSVIWWGWKVIWEGTYS